MNSKSINIWLDDQRSAPDGWIHLHNLDEVKQTIELLQGVGNVSIDTMSFDFNLAHPKNGLDVMKYLAEQCKKHKTKNFWPKTILYHSNDSVGVELMQDFETTFKL